MHVRQTLLILGAVLCVAVGSVAAQFAVGRLFSVKQPPASEPLPTSRDQQRLPVDVSLLPVDGETAPEELAAPADASPIVPRNSEQDTATRTIIQQELPHATLEEREIWFEEVKGMPAQKIRDLLRLRRMFGSQQPFQTGKRPRPAPGDALAPMPLPKPDRHSQVSRPSVQPLDLHDEAVARLQPTFAALCEARNVILNNIANANTTGFKRSRVIFADLPYEQIETSDRRDSGGQPIRKGIAVGSGVEIVATQLDHSGGSLRKTDGRFDLAIVGDGFFQIQDGPDILYTRCGRFTLNADGNLVLVSFERGRSLEPVIHVPADAAAVYVSADGVVSVRRAESGKKRLPIGQIQLARFVAPAGLEQRGANLFAPTEATSPPQVGNPGTAGCGELRQGYLETSNVDLESELARLKSIEKQWQTLWQALSFLSPAGIARPTRAK